MMVLLIDHKTICKPWHTLERVFYLHSKLDLVKICLSIWIFLITVQITPSFPIVCIIVILNNNFWPKWISGVTLVQVAKVVWGSPLTKGVCGASLHQTNYGFKNDIPIYWLLYIWLAWGWGGRRGFTFLEFLGIMPMATLTNYSRTKLLLDVSLNVFIKCCFCCIPL